MPKPSQHCRSPKPIPKKSQNQRPKTPAKPAQAPKKPKSPAGYVPISPEYSQPSKQSLSYVPISPEYSRGSKQRLDVFVSPVAWSKHPSFERDVNVILNILENGNAMCRNQIAPEYIENQLNDKAVGVWLIRDSKAKIFGFAFTKERMSMGHQVIELRLICTHKRKGEGTALFRDILQHAHNTKHQVELDAVNAKVGMLYAEAALSMEFKVFLDDSPKHLSWEQLKDALFMNFSEDDLIPMRFMPRNYEAPRSQLSFSAQSYKSIIRQLQYDSDSSLDD